MNAKIIKRDIEQNIESSLFNGKVCVIYGARQSGKITLVNMVRENILLDEPEYQEKFD